MSQFYASYPHLLHPPPISPPTARPRVPSQLGQGSSSGAGLQASASTSGLGIGGKLRSMLDRQKYAIFQIDLTLHELGNVPQLEGEFAVRWRFRGKRPKARDAVHRLHPPHPHAAPTPKPSLPNLKLTYASSTHPSSSSASIRSSSTNGTGDSASIRSVPVHGPGPQSHGMKGKSMSTPPLPLSMTSMNGNGNGKGKGRMDKKGSDPTPLRNSASYHDNEGDGELVQVESPSPVDSTPTSDRSVSVYRAGSSTPTPMPTAGPSRSSTLPPTHPLATPLASRSLAPSAAPSTVASSASSSTSLLSVPAGAGAGMERTVSGSGSTRTGSSADQASLGVRNGDRPSIRRIRSGSGSSVNPGPGPAGGTGSKLTGGGGVSARRGVTPGRPLKSHTCTWDHDLSLSLRLPISKSPAPPASAAAGGRAGQVLGEGSESASGLQLIIEQLPTAAATSAAHAKVSDPNLRQTAADGQQQHNAHRRPTGERTVFGKVDIDLAAFAGRGRTTRKFLLHGSRTNATVKITVDMTFMGGEQNWVAPPLQEGHHVTQQLKEIMGGRDAGQDLERDLQLVKTPSGSSDSNESSISRTHSSKSHNASTASLNLNLARQPSSTITSQAPRPQYKTYDQHLLSPEDARTPGRGRDTPPTSAKTPQDTASSTRSTFSFHRHHHHHHRHLRHHHHHHQQHQHRTQGITELPAEAVIEHIFNPYESHEEGPFTFLPEVEPAGPGPAVTVLGEDEEHHEHAPPAQQGQQQKKEKERIGWRRRPKPGTNTPAMSRTASGLGVVFGAASGTAGGTLGVSAMPHPARPASAQAQARVASAAH